MKAFTLAVLVLATLFLVPIASAQNKPATGAELLFQLEAEFAQAVADHGRAAFVTYFADEGVELDDGGGISTRDDFSPTTAVAGCSLDLLHVDAPSLLRGDVSFGHGW